MDHCNVPRLVLWIFMAELDYFRTQFYLDGLFDYSLNVIFKKISVHLVVLMKSKLFQMNSRFQDGSILKVLLRLLFYWFFPFLKIPQKMVIMLAIPQILCFKFEIIQKVGI